MGSPGTAQTSRERWEATRALLAAQRRGPPPRPRPLGSQTPASFSQNRFWFLDELQPNHPAQTLAVTHDLRGQLDLPALADALDQMVRRHEVLRTSFVYRDGRLDQVIEAPVRPALQQSDLSDRDAEARDAEGRTFVDKLVRAPFDLSHGPLFRCALLRLAQDEHRLVIVFHHAIFDGWSFEVFMGELSELYAAACMGRPAMLAEPVLQFADVALWQHESFTDEKRERLLSYWTRVLECLPAPLRLPTSYPRRPERHRCSAVQGLVLPPDIAREIGDFSRARGVTVFTTLLSAFLALLHRLTGQDDIIVGSPVASRLHSELRGVIGPLANTLPLRVRLAGETQFRTLVERTSKALSGALENQDLPFEHLVKALNPPREPGEPLLAQVLFAYQNVPRARTDLPGLQVTSRDIPSPAAAFDLTLFVEDTAQGLVATLHYDASLFCAEDAATFLDRFVLLTRGAVAEPGSTVATLPLLAPDERRWLIEELNDTAVPYPRDASIHALFAEQAATRTDAPALVADGAVLTYSELEASANRLARYLVRLGVRTQARIGLSMRRSPELVVAMLATLKAGCTYVPLDPAMPRGYGADLLRSVDAAALVTDEAWVEGDASPDLLLVALDRDREAIDAGSAEPLGIAVPADALANVMFTSGTTGGSKAVAVTHRGVVRLVCGANYVELTSQDVVLHAAPVAFDASTFEIWAPLLNGAVVAFAPPGPAHPETFGDTLQRHGATIAWLTAGLFEVMVDHAVQALASLQQLFVGGDVVSPSHAARFLAAAPSCRLVNCYGPTENTTFSCYHPITAEDIRNGMPLAIGRPVSNTRVYVLDKAMQPVPVGVEGEAWLGGDGIARGYLNDPDLTRARFVPDPFEARPGAHLYRTGDRFRRRACGTLEFLGRVDAQTKIRGVRVEPGQVEAAICECPGIRQACVAVRGSGAADKRLIAYIVPDGSGPLPRDLRERLRARLPEPMIPAAFIRMDHLPLNSNGKIDRRALSAFEEPTQASEAAADPVERRLQVIFSDVLGTSSIGVHESFFDRGGHSLLAVELVLRIEEEFGAPLPLIALFETPTVAGLAPRLVEPDPASFRTDGRDPALIQVRRGDETQPLFIVPGGHGGLAEMALYARLLHPLHPGRAAFGLLVRGLDGAEPVPRTVEEVATDHIRAIRKAQPHGPYLIAGECVGGAVAYEIGQQLLQQGEAVSALIILDGWCPSAAGQRHYEWIVRPRTVLKDRRTILGAAHADLGNVLKEHRGVLRQLDWRRKPQQLKRTIPSLARVALAWAARLLEAERPHPGQSARAERAYVRALMRYRPRRYPGIVTLIASQASLHRGIAEGWQSWADGGLRLHAVPGDHETYLREHPAAVLDALASCLDEGQSDAAEAEA